jgi:hypothetical protein
MLQCKYVSEFPLYRQRSILWHPRLDFNDKLDGAPKFAEERPQWMEGNYPDEFGYYASTVMGKWLFTSGAAIID